MGWGEARLEFGKPQFKPNMNYEELIRTPDYHVWLHKMSKFNIHTNPTLQGSTNKSLQKPPTTMHLTLFTNQHYSIQSINVILDWIENVDKCGKNTTDKQWEKLSKIWYFSHYMTKNETENILFKYGKIIRLSFGFLSCLVTFIISHIGPPKWLCYLHPSCLASGPLTN